MQADHNPGLRNSIDDHSDDYKSKNQSCIGVKMFKKVSAVLNFYMRRYKLFKVVLFFFGISLVLSHIRKGIILPSVPPQALSNVTYDHRSFIINGKRQLLIVGAIHYPRSSPGMWPHLFKKTKEAGINAIDTYVFWNLHEPLEGQFDFETGYANLPLFLKLAQEHGLYVILRIGPYVCAEWNLGGIPSWLLEKPGMVFRTWNEPFMEAMEVFVRQSVNIARPYLASVGGPIIAMQMENEYGNVQAEYGIEGSKYIVWAADLANSLDTGVPWFMCQQNNIDTILLTCNGFYCHDWIKRHWKYAYNTPPMFTELWTGWFQHWATPKMTRPAEDLAFAVALWFAKGGTFLTYYMWHGGTNFQRWAGDFKTTSYDYDSPLNEYGFETVKNYHLARLHKVLNDNAELILSKDPKITKFGKNQEAHVFGDLSSSNTLVFLINSDTENDGTINLYSQHFRIPKWSALILQKGVDGRLNEVFCSSSIAPHPKIHNYRDPSLSPAIIEVTQNAITWIKEPAGIWDASQSVVFERPAEQIRFTYDKTDYLWYERNNLDISVGTDQTVTISIEPPTDLVYVYIDGQLAHSKEVTVMNVNMDQQGGKNYVSSTEVIIPASKFSHSPFNLSILSVTLGLLNYGAFYDNVKKGIYGSIKIANQDITTGNWVHQRGLEGEAERYYENPGIHNWRSDISQALFIPLVWYKITITSDQIKNLLNQNFGAYDLVSFALYLGSMGKGYAWITTEEEITNSIGRYWDASSNSIECPTCEWIGPFDSNKCPVGCSGPSQSYYHIPKDWIIGEADPSDLEIVLFEERGGDPSGVKLVLLK